MPPPPETPDDIVGEDLSGGRVEYRRSDLSSDPEVARKLAKLRAEPCVRRFIIGPLGEMKLEEPPKHTMTYRLGSLAPASSTTGDKAQIGRPASDGSLTSKAK